MCREREEDQECQERRETSVPWWVITDVTNGKNQTTDVSAEQPCSWMEACLRWPEGSFSVLQGSIGDPGPAGYGGMKVKYSQSYGKEEILCWSSNFDNFRKIKYLSLNVFAACFVYIHASGIISFFWFFFACLIKNADTCLSVSRETAVAEERRWGPNALSASSTSSVFVWSDATNSWTDCLFPAGWKRTQRLQGERSSPLLCLSAATFIHHALTVYFICFSQGDKGFRGRDGTDGRKVSLGETNNAALTVISGLDVVSWCPFLILIFLFQSGRTWFPRPFWLQRISRIGRESLVWHVQTQ